MTDARGMLYTGFAADEVPATGRDTLTIELSRADAQALYDHTGTMPHAPGSWANNVRDTLSEGLATWTHTSRTL